MDRYRGKTSTFFSKLANGLGTRLRPAIVPLSKSLGPPGPQTCHSTSSRISSMDQPSISSRLIFTVFEFPEELILSIVSHVSPDSGQYAGFHFQHVMDTRDCYRQRLAFLVSLGMTCRAMWLRLLLWIWERVEMDSEDLVRRPNAIVGALHADPYVGMSVKYFHPFICLWVGADLCPLKVSDDISLTG